MKISIYTATYNKNELLPNTLKSIIRQNIPFDIEYCFFDDHSDVDPEPIIRKFIPNAKYRRSEKQVGFDVVTTFVNKMVSTDTDIIIMQSADVMHGNKNTIERLCNCVSEKTICMATVANTNPTHDMYLSYNKQLPIIETQWNEGIKRSNSRKPYFFLGAIKYNDYKSLKCVDEPHCDIILRNEIRRNNFEILFPEDIKGFHQEHSTSTVPCTRLKTCKIRKCALRKRCNELGWKSIDDYWKSKEK
jgi:glycosyltransferase involved in cell wall biosynthesis